MLDPWDSVCLRAASVEWNVPGKYGPHGELFFFLIKKEPATMPGGVTFSPFFTANVRTSFFFVGVLKKCALIAMHFIAEEERGGCRTPGLGNTWRFGCPRIRCGRVRMKVKLGVRTKAFLQVFLERIVCATVRCTSLGCVGLVTLLGGLVACERGVKLSHCPGYVPGNA